MAKQIDMSALIEAETGYMAPAELRAMRIEELRKLARVSWAMQRYIPKVEGAINEELLSARVVTGSAATVVDVIEEEYSSLGKCMDAVEGIVRGMLRAMRWRAGVSETEAEGEEVEKPTLAVLLTEQMSSMDALAAAMYDEALRRFHLTRDATIEVTDKDKDKGDE